MRDVVHLSQGRLATHTIPVPPETYTLLNSRSNASQTQTIGSAAEKKSKILVRLCLNLAAEKKRLSFNLFLPGKYQTTWEEVCVYVKLIVCYTM